MIVVLFLLLLLLLLAVLVTLHRTHNGDDRGVVGHPDLTWPAPLSIR